VRPRLAPPQVDDLDGRHRAAVLALQALAGVAQRAAQRELLAGTGATPLREARAEELPPFDEEEKDEGGATAPVVLHPLPEGGDSGAGPEKEGGGFPPGDPPAFLVENPLARRGAARSAPPLAVAAKPAPPAPPAPGEGAQANLFAPLFSRWKPQVRPLTGAAPASGALPPTASPSGHGSAAAPLRGRPRST
jgi:hypothetical protein